MNAASETMRAITTCAVEMTAETIDAGGEIRLVGVVTCAPPRDLRGRAFLIRDEAGVLVAAAEITESDGERSRTAEMVVRAPVRTGTYAWLAALPAYSADAVAYDEASTPFVFTVRPHGAHLSVWDTPSTLVAGERFSVKVGVTCTSACRPAGWTIEISDDEGAVAASAAPGDEPWRGTTALYFAEIGLEAPATEGLFRYTARAPGPGHEIDHEERTVEFGVRVVPAPQFVLRIEAVDEGSQSPVKGARVVAHPYRAFTDDRGVAELKVAQGDYTIFVSGRRRLPFRTVGAVTADITIRADLCPDRGLSDADIWS